MSKPSPRPWGLNQTGFTVAAGSERVASCRFMADSAHIVKCVNMHEELVQALKCVLYAMNAEAEQGVADWSEAHRSVRAAIDKAEGRSTGNYDGDDNGPISYQEKKK